VRQKGEGSNHGLAVMLRRCTRHSGGGGGLVRWRGSGCGGGRGESRRRFQWWEGKTVNGRGTVVFSRGRNGGVADQKGECKKQ